MRRFLFNKYQISNKELPSPKFATTYCLVNLASLLVNSIKLSVNVVLPITSCIVTC